jgi:hypothetical protein
MGKRNFLFSPQSQFRNRNSVIAILQAQFRNRNSAIATLQLEGSTSAITIPQLKKNVAWQPQHRNSAIAIFLKSATSSPQLESFTSAIFDIFLAFGEFHIIFF